MVDIATPPALATPPAQPARRRVPTTDRAMGILQYATAVLAIVAAVLLAGLR
jgi:hypothetical protein